MKKSRLAMLATVMLSLSACTPSIAEDTDVTSDPFAYPGAPTSPSTGDQPQSDLASAPSHGYYLPSLPSLRRASGELTVLIDEEAALPQRLVDDFAQATGVAVTVLPLSAADGAASVDVVVGVDAQTLADPHKAALVASSAPEDTSATHPIEHTPAAVDYARDDVCILADVQWYTLNRSAVPGSLEAVATPGVAQQLVLAPHDSSVARAFDAHITQTLAGGAPTWLTNVKAGAKAPQSWDEAARASTVRLREQHGTKEVLGRPAWAGGVPGPHSSSDADLGTHPLRVAPVSVAARSTANTQTSGYVLPVEGSCAERYLYAVSAAQPHNSDAVEAFLTYIRSERAQRILALTGAAVPLSDDIASDTPIAWYTQQ